jgi:hypothetical protein
MTQPAALHPAVEAAKPWLAEPNVVGLGLGRKLTGGRDTGRQAVIVFVERKLPAAQVGFAVPATAGGLPTDVQESAPLRAHALSQKVRPVPGGYQIEAANIGGTGTLGLNIDWRGAYSGISNNHVLANNGNVGQPVYQPDKGHDNAIGLVAGFVPVPVYASAKEPRPEYATQDLAWFGISRDIGSSTVYRIGEVTGMRRAVAGEEVELIGAASGSVRTAVVEDVDFVGVIDFDHGGRKPYAYFQQLIRLDRAASRPGDSGAAYIATKDRKAVGINIGGDSFAVGCQLVLA